MPSLREFYSSIAGIPVAERPLQLQALATLGQYRHAYDLVPRFIGDAHTVLDWGCGNGHFSRFLHENGLDVTGYSYEGPPTFLLGAERFHFVPGTDGEPVKLTAQEYKLLSYLMHHKGKVVSRTELIEHIYDQDFDRDSNTIEVFVTRIRKKLGADVITTIRGLGYSLDDPGLSRGE